MFPPKIKLLKQNLSVNSHTPQIFRSNWSFWRGINSDLFSPVTVGLNILSKSAIKWKTYENYISCFFSHDFHLLLCFLLSRNIEPCAGVQRSSLWGCNSNKASLITKWQYCGEISNLRNTNPAVLLLFSRAPVIAINRDGPNSGLGKEMENHASRLSK